ncbi:MAG: type VI secretion system membrane subunit TssM [Saezia sp.]
MNKIISYLKRFALPLVKQFKTSVPFMIAVCLVLLAILVWWLGPEWEFRGSKPLESLLARVTATIVLLIIPLFWWTLSTRKKYQKLEGERKYHEAVELDSCIPYVQAQDRHMDESFAALKANSLNSDFLYKLPWYLVLGQENSGKTSLINRSNQSFTLTSVMKAAAVKGMKDPYLAYPIDWWIGNEAVLIDPPGEIISQIVDQENIINASDQDSNATHGENAHQKSALPTELSSRLWSALIEWLDKKRSSRPLNGIILTIDLPLLLSQTPSERKAMAVFLRARMFELSQKLGIRFPIYIVLTKFDLVEGFDEFFAKLPRDVRENVLGFSFTLNSVHNYDVWLDEFVKDYDALIQGLKEQVFDDIGTPHTLKEREDLFSFFSQLAGVRNILFAYLTEILGSDNYSTPALVRGVFFSSVYQEGLLSNAFVTEAAKTYRVSGSIPQAKEHKQGVIYFAQKLFTDVIYPEAGLAGDNIKVLQQKKQILYANATVAATVCVLAFSGWQYYYTFNRDKALAVESTVEGFDHYLKTTQGLNAYLMSGDLDKTGKELLPALNQIREAVSIFGNYREAVPVLQDMGLYEGRKIGPKVDETYIYLLSHRFLAALSEGVMDSINAAPSGSDEQLAALRVYQMMQNLKNRRPEIVQHWMLRSWQSSYPNDGVTQENLMSHLEYAMRYAQSELPHWDAKIGDVQEKLSRIPMQQRVYMSMKASSRDVLVRPLSLRNEVGLSFDMVFKPVRGATETSQQVSANRHNVVYDATSQPLLLDALFTTKGFKDYFAPRSEDIADLAMVDEWVLGKKDSIYYSEEDIKVMRERINTLYVTDYIDTWHRALNQFEVVDFKDVQHGVTVLETVVSTSAPFRRLLETVKDNSEIYTSLSSGADNAAGVPQNAAPTEAKVVIPPLKDSLQSESLRISRAFAPLYRMLDSNNEKPSTYDDLMKVTSELYEYMKLVQDSPDRGKVALQLVMDRFELKGADPISNLQRMSVGLPEPMNRHAAKLAQQAERILIIEALKELENRWDRDVYKFYSERLAPRYPFNSASRYDVSLDDFEKFFGPRGVLEEFTNKYLNAFLKDNINSLYSKEQGRYLIRTDLLEQFETANRIRDAFFNSQGALNIQFTVQPLGMTANTRSSLLNVDGQLIAYRHGPSTTVGLIWPNSLSDGVVSKVTLINSAGGSSEISAKGPWSFFRLLSQGKEDGEHSSTSVQLKFVVGQNAMTYRILSEKMNNPFTSMLFHGFKLPRTLLNNEALNESGV